MRLTCLAPILALVTAFVVAVRGQTPTLDRASQQAEILRHFRALVQLDTSNPPGNERRAVEYLESVLSAEGIPSRTFALDPSRPREVPRHSRDLELSAAAAQAVELAERTALLTGAPVGPEHLLLSSVRTPVGDEPSR